MRTPLHAEKKSLVWRNVVFGTFAALALCLFAAQIFAQPLTGTTKPTPRPRYDITKEVTITGSISSVVKRATPSMKMMPGSHLVVTTSSGTVDASLGRFAMKGKNPLSFTAGEQVRLTGVIHTTSTGKEVFMARLVQANGHIYKIRNEHGFAYAPAARKDSAKSESKGGSL